MLHFLLKMAGTIPVIPPDEGFPVGAVVVALTDISGGSSGNVPCKDMVISRSAVITLTDGVGLGMMGDRAVLMFIGW